MMWPIYYTGTGICSIRRICTYIHTCMHMLLYTCTVRIIPYSHTIIVTSLVLYILMTHDHDKTYIYAIISNRIEFEAMTAAG